MENLQTVTRYGRWELRCGSGTSSVRICSPSGVVTERSCFLRQPGRLVTDDHGYESVIPAGEPCFCVRYTPTEAGIYTYESDNGESGCFLSEEAGLHGYVRVSEKDPRYFCFTDGTPFPVIGMNLASLTAYPQTVKREFGLTDERAYLGIREYERWFRKLSEAGGNHARIWLGQEYLCVDTDDPEAPDLLQFEKVDALDRKSVV